MEEDSKPRSLPAESAREVVEGFATLPIIYQLEYVASLLTNRGFADSKAAETFDPVLATAVEVLDGVIEALSEYPEAAYLTHGGLRVDRLESKRSRDMPHRCR